jgi:hypothetical protein
MTIPAELVRPLTVQHRLLFRVHRPTPLTLQLAEFLANYRTGWTILFRAQTFGGLFLAVRSTVAPIPAVVMGIFLTSRALLRLKITVLSTNRL